MSTVPIGSLMLATTRCAANFVARLSATTEYMKARGVDVSAAVCDDMAVSRAMANIVGQFRKSDARFLLYVDPLATWHPRTASWVLRSSLSSGAVLCVSEEVLHAEERAEVDKRVVDVQSGPAAFVLIPRAVIRSLCEKHPELAYAEPGSGRMVDLFGPTVREGILYGETAAFFGRCRDAGFSVRTVQRRS